VLNLIDFFHHTSTHPPSSFQWAAHHLYHQRCPKRTKKKGEKPFTCGGKRATYVINLFVKEYEKYNKNKASTTRAWSEKMKKHEKFKDLNVTGAQIENFIATQITNFHRAMEKRESPGFGDDEELGSAEDQLIDVCRYWYKSMHLRTR
jgi:hypothetical protein